MDRNPMRRECVEAISLECDATLDTYPDFAGIIERCRRALEIARHLPDVFDGCAMLGEQRQWSHSAHVSLLAPVHMPTVHLRVATAIAVGPAVRPVEVGRNLEKHVRLLSRLDADALAAIDG